MSVNTMVHPCTCLDKAPLTVDGDTDAVYHETCEGFISDLSDFAGLTDPFWNDQMKSRNDAVVIGGTQYRIGSTPYPAKGYGFGGSEFTIKRKDTGEVIKTRDLWHQGDVPEAYKGILQDNAVWVRKIEVKYVSN